MPTYVIERNMPGAGRLPAEDLTAVARKSCQVLSSLGPEIEWVQSYVTADKVYCIYVSPNEDLILDYSRLGGFPVNSIAAVNTVIGPVKV